MNQQSEVAMSEHLADDLLSTTAGGWRSFYDLLSRRFLLAPRDRRAHVPYPQERSDAHAQAAAA